jgi:hypothetical protein
MAAFLASIIPLQQLSAVKSSRGMLSTPASKLAKIGHEPQSAASVRRCHRCVGASSWTELATRYDSSCSLGLFDCSTVSTTATPMMAHDSRVSKDTPSHQGTVIGVCFHHVSEHRPTPHAKSTQLALNSFPPLRHIRYIRNPFTHSAVQTLSKLWGLKFLR